MGEIGIGIIEPEVGEPVNARDFVGIVLRYNHYTYFECNKKSPMNEHKVAIARSKAGRRFIAQMSMYNEGDFERLREFMELGYYDLILMENPIDRRIFDLKTTRKLHGRLKVDHVEIADEYAITVVMATEKNDKHLRLEMIVHEDYPHQIMHYSLLPLDEAKD